MKDIEDLEKIVVDHTKWLALRGGISRESVGKILGVSANQIANYEMGRKTPPGDRLLRLMMLYNVRPEDIATVASK